MKIYSTFGQVEVKERIWRSPQRSYQRVLPEAIGIAPKGYSKRLQRVVCDFAWDESFRRANERIAEHYGFELVVERVRQTALEHAHAIEQERQRREPVGRLRSSGPAFVIAEADGSMVRVVTTATKGDRRKVRRLEWKEARLAAAQAQGSCNTFYEATFGGVADLGKQWAHAVNDAGWGSNSFIHVLGDGANWVCQQAAQNLGEKHRFTLDLFHVCEYLAEAAPNCRRRETPSRWTKRHKTMLLKGKADKVIANLKAHVEPAHLPEEDAPVRRAFRYLNNRQAALDYPFALAHNLPVGSGLIEGGNRHVIQARLKGPGMAWTSANAQALMQARSCRCSGLFNAYWQN